MSRKSDAKKVKIGIFSTSLPVQGDEKCRYSYLKKNGFEIYEHPQVTKIFGHVAGSIDERVNAIYKMLEDPSIDILMSYWGGANTNQILPYLDYEMFRKYPKPIIGYSDTSALLLAVHKFANIKTFMGPCGITFDKPDPFEYSLKYFNDVVIDKRPCKIDDSPYFADDLYFLRKDSNHRIMKKNEGRKIYKHGKASGDVIASNLQTLMVLAGTKYFPDLSNKILFLEECEDVNTMMVHRFFTHLSQVIDLKTLLGICIGRFSSDSKFSRDDPETLIYDDLFRDLTIPIIYNLDFGHTDPLFTIPIGGKANIDTEDNIISFF